MADADRYIRAVAMRVDGQLDDFATLPTLLAAACVDVLPIDGAGLSVMSNIRLPLGSSDHHAALVEQLQVTLGVGPCLTAAAQTEPSVSDETTIADRWPVFHHDLVQQTPYRSVMSMPLSMGGYVAALDLYSTDPAAAQFPPVEEVWITVGAPITELLSDVPTRPDLGGTEVPSWLVNHRVDSRYDVWVAAGILMQHQAMPSGDAITLLRAHAFAHSETLDHVAGELVHQRLTAHDIIGTS